MAQISQQNAKLVKLPLRYVQLKRHIARGIRGGNLTDKENPPEKASIKGYLDRMMEFAKKVPGELQTKVSQLTKKKPAPNASDEKVRDKPKPKPNPEGLTAPNKTRSKRVRR